MTPALRLVREDAPIEDVLPFERRVETRRPVEGRATALATGTDDASSAKASLCKIVSMRLCDVSPNGLGAVVDEPLEVGAKLEVVIPPHGAEPSAPWQGVVARCDVIRGGRACRVGVRLQHTNRRSVA